MHCLGAVTNGTPSPNGNGSRGGILSVYRALGVLVCEGRVQGPPRGYKEGPHCAPPLQPVPNGHVCEQDNYLCDRYSVLVREITDRASSGTCLCVEVLLCSDCSCGLAKATSKNPISTVPSSSISSWQHASELLLEYWCICVVPNKGPETMNFQGLYQAVRSRLHFSQVAAWWSRSNGGDPSYIATRVVPYNEDNMTRFRDVPVEHTFPLAGNGDGNSIKVSVWALPRMEGVPILSCSLHPIKENGEEVVARALTPTKAIPAATTSQNPENLVLPALVDDRLQTPCNKPGKHHCRCEDEDSSPPSPSIPRVNGERKRRRSLPCGPADPPGPSVNFQSNQPAPLPSVQECTLRNTNVSSSHSRSTQSPSNQDNDNDAIRTRNNLNSDSLECRFRTQLSFEEQECNTEKRYKRTIENEDAQEANTMVGSADDKSRSSKSEIAKPNEKVTEQVERKPVEGSGSFMNYIAFNTSLPWSFVESWNNSAANSKCGFQSLRIPKEARANNAPKFYAPPVEYSRTFKDTHGPIDPFQQPSPFHESNPGPSTNYSHSRAKLDTLNSACTVHRSYSKPSINKFNSSRVIPLGKETPESEVHDSSRKRVKSNKDLCESMAKLSLPEDKEKPKEEGGILDWFSRVPGRMLGVAPSCNYVEEKNKKPITPGVQSQEPKNEVRFKNGNLELSQREFDEVLAVLRARTPSGRRRAPVRTAKRRENKSEKSEGVSEKVYPRSVSNFDDNESSLHMIVNRGQVKTCNSQEIFKNGLGTVAASEHNCKICGKRIWKENEAHTCIANSVKNLHNNKSIYYLSNYRQDQSVNSKMMNGEEKPEMLEKQSSNTADCSQNVSNKADVLLGAILRTSKEKKDVCDNSNKSKPRSTLPEAKFLNQNGCQSSAHDDNICEEPCVVLSINSESHEDEISLPQTLNKKFHRFRQFFKKEQDKKLTLGYPEEQSANSASRFISSNTIQPSLHEPKNKVKRKIDFSNFHAGARAADKNECYVDESTNNAHQNSKKHSTNGQENDVQVEEACKTDSVLLKCQKDRTVYYNNLKESYTEIRDECDDQKTACRKAHCDTVSVQEDPAPTVPQNGYSSSKAWSNGYKIDASVDETDETPDKTVPSAIEQERFRRSLENAASMVFHSRTGLPLTSSPAPLRRGSCCFDYDSSLNSVSSKRSALFELNTPPSPGAVSLEETDRETENAGEETPRKRSTSRGRPQSHALLGSFEESALNGRLEPVSTVHGFTAEIGASGSFCPKHRKLPVTVFFYTLGDNDKVSTPYLAHINLGKKGYQVPRSGTIQVTLLNPLGTVVKMFVVLYDLSDMPPRSHTFLRQRTLRDKTLRYLVHLRFMSGKSGRIYLHTDIRMIICRKSDVDTASDFGSEPPKELRSYIHGPTNPKFSPRC